ncbi:replication initiation regulator SeqA [Psychromonas sp. PT13]|uniref:replication initiation regulator SeqA n=1 Tax=Psychromonas sp. PT13 TaxID=3439547 RepID=UPI003EBFFFC0
MKKIEIEEDLYKYILANIEEFGETPSQILRRLLGLSTQEQTQPDISPESHQPEEIKKDDLIDVTPPELPTEEIIQHDNNLSLPDSLANGVSALFSDPTFKSEPIITNKFKMMLTAMYYENKAGFIVAANTTRGRTRDYLGQNLETLLASDNKEEVAQLKASKPHNIPYTPYWVITNANTGRKRIILTQMMASMGYPHHLIERIKDEI